jgi:putative DNA-invertase from lambdoid prophage Rac
MTTVYYLRVSTKDQSVESQRQALGIPPDVDPASVFMDEGVSGAVDALDRPGFARCAAYLRAGDVLRVSALDRLGRNAIDVQQTFAYLLGKAVIVDVLGMGVVAGDVGKLLVTILSGVAEMERARIAQRTEAGRQAARESLAGPTGRTHRGKTSLGRPFTTDPAAIKAWRESHGASQTQTAAHFGVSLATVKRACASAAA